MQRTVLTLGESMGISARTDSYNLDKRVIAYWEVHKKLPPFIQKDDRGLLKELRDAIPLSMSELRKEIGSIMP